MASKPESKTAVVDGIKVGDLAKEFGVQTKVIVEMAKSLHIEVKNAATVLKRGQADRLRAKLGGSEELRAALETKKKNAPKKGATKAGRTSAGDDDEAEGEAEVVEAEAEAAPEAVAEPVEEVVAAPVAEAPVEEPPAAEPEPAPVVAPPPPAEPVPVAASTAPIPVPPPPAAPVEPPKPRHMGYHPAPSAVPALPETRFIQAGPDLAPPVRREAAPPAAAPTGSRFGVVMTAETAKQVHGEVAPRPGAKKPAETKGGKPATAVESKAVDDFKAQVSYPKFAETTVEEDGPKGARGPGGSGPGPRRGPVKGPRRGMASGPSHGRALMNQDDRFRGRGGRSKAPKQSKTQVITRTGPAEVTSPVTIKGLCEALGIKSNELIMKFLKEGKTVMINSILTDDDAMLYASEFDPLKFGIKIKKARDVEEELLAAAQEPDSPEDLRPRAPVVTIMGHVDHGKTSLLDYIRKTKVAAGEAGGITQHIRAYKVGTGHGDVVFLDTPGHKAFTEMRARGANVTDIVVLVVSAVDGVMPQTEEAISHARAANRRLVVALNKVDMPEANVDRVKGQLASKEVFVEGYGGEVGCVSVSAKTGQGVDELIERLLLESEVLQLKANPDKLAVGTTVEAHKDQGRGIEATLLVQEGTLSVGDVLICGHAYGTVRQLVNDRGEDVESVGPSTPVLITGLNDVPLSGERFHVMEDIKEAAEIAEKRAMLMRQEGLVKRQHVTLENLHAMLAEGQVASLRLIVKVDVVGSQRPVEQAVAELATSEAKVEILHSAIGAVNETDVTLADASDAIVVGFSVSADPGARRMAEERGVEIRTYRVIYDLVDDMRKALEGLLKPLEKEAIQAHVSIRQTFKISKVGTIAGCFVTDGTVNRNSSVRLVRDGKPIWTGKIQGLRRVKDDVREVREGFECGIKLDGYDDLKEGDVLECFVIEQVARTLEGSAK